MLKPDSIVGSLLFHAGYDLRIIIPVIVSAQELGESQHTQEFAKEIMVVTVGSILGAAFGNAIGVNVHSDNLPFFSMLGTLIGLCLSGVASLILVR